MLHILDVLGACWAYWMYWICWICWMYCICREPPPPCNIHQLCKKTKKWSALENLYFNCKIQPKLQILTRPIFSAGLSDDVAPGTLSETYLEDIVFEIRVFSNKIPRMAKFNNENVHTTIQRQIVLILSSNSMQGNFVFQYKSKTLLIPLNFFWNRCAHFVIVSYHLTIKPPNSL